MRTRWVLCALPLAACVTTIEEHASPIGEVVRDCVVPPPAGVAVLDAPVSLEYPDRSLWLWEELPGVDGIPRRGVGAWVASVDDACAGPRLIADSAGAPAAVLALSPAEEAANASRTDGKRLALAPTGGVVHGGTGYLFYDLVERGPGPLDAITLGTGLCTLAPDATACDRVADGAGATLLWAPTARVLDRGGVVVADADAAGGARAVIAGCRRVAAFDDPCVVTGAPVAALAEPAAYQVYSVFAGWVDALTDATTFADAPGALTLAPYDGGYLATSMAIFDHRVDVRRSSRATDGYGRPIAAFDVVPPDAWWFVRGGREHAALRPTPRSIVVSYATDGAAAPGLHVVAFRFFGDFQ